MFNFKSKTQPAPEARIPDDWLERLDAIAAQLDELKYAQSEIKRTLVRIETKVSIIGIAAGYLDPARRGQA